MTSFEDFKKLEIKIGKIISVERVLDTDKLLRLMVDVGEEGHRQIISGIAEYFEDIQILVGKKCPFVTNLEAKTIRGYESNGMILAVSTSQNKFSLLVPDKDIPAGSVVR